MKEWYLQNEESRPNITGGYEGCSFNDYKYDAFYEALETDIATTVLLYNYDKTISIEIRCIIQDNLANTQLKSMERSVLAPMGTLKAGMYIFHENVYWLISGYPGTNGVYEKATMVLCQYKLRWQNYSGNIIERWCNGTSASKYDVGENGNSIIRLSSNTFTLLLPDDDEVLELDGKRVFIDKHKQNPTKVYKVTRSDDILYHYGETHGGILCFIADKTVFNPITDNQELRICDYHSPVLPTKPLAPGETTVSISGGNTLRYGRTKTWEALFTDHDGTVVDCEFKWNIVSDFEMHQNVNNNKISIKLTDDSLIGESFLLQIIMSGKVAQEKSITITEGF